MTHSPSQRGIPPGFKMELNTRRVEAHTRYLLQRSIDYFDHWRRNIQWIDAERELEYTGFPIPYRPSPVEDPALRDSNTTIPDRRYRPFRQVRRRDDGAGRTVEPVLRSHIEGLGLRMVKILGAGSQGLAVLFESTESTADQPPRKIVFKWSGEIWSTMIEMWCMRQMVGARHIVQEVVDDDYISQLLGGPPLMIYAMEFMEHGSFNDNLATFKHSHFVKLELLYANTTDTCTQRLAIRISERNVLLKDSEMWRIFYCLFRACVALAYPGRWDKGLDPAKEVVKTQEEFIPMQEGQPVRTDLGLIDFDINDRNVMIGEDESVLAPGEHPHDVVPIFKIGDLGNVGAFREPRHREGLLSPAAWRVAGNPWFTVAWEGVSDAATLAQDDTAGKYDWWTNYLPIVPPDCVTASVTVGDGSKKDMPTYSVPLQSNINLARYDPLLMDTVSWCMAHRPGDRPTMLQLEQRIRSAVDRDWSTEASAGRVTIKELLSDPPAPRPST
ncbi:hypothetical protein N8I77_003332 [Diaporthe amygdali]|uniref:Protein kinase domain-containing protein n=1 Tax=Phomopsis amygdali TaxID=1214568 RepID=A0AAD9SHR6_PHOAM|nr:hypothetical protein N8I77_003332 [Diaporthe amygdali]